MGPLEADAELLGFYRDWPELPLGWFDLILMEPIYDCGFDLGRKKRRGQMKFSTTPLYESQAERLKNDTLALGGTTYPVPEDHGYMVSLEGMELKIPEHMFVFGGQWFIMGYASAVADHLYTGKFMGTWIYEGDVYLDVSTWTADRGAALTLAKLCKQLAIFDIAAHKSITVKEAA